MTNRLEVAALGSLTLFSSALLTNKLPLTQKSELVQQDLYFGRNIGTNGRVTEAQFHKFINDIVTPEFSTGVTIYDTEGQFFDSKGNLIREPSQVISVVFKDTPNNQKAITRITNAYKHQFQQESVLQVENEDIAIDRGTDLIDNDPTPELIQVDLYFGESLYSENPAKLTDRVNNCQFRQFLQDVAPAQ